ncbi:DUF3182 family protein [Luteimonas sp. XNQY3]|nr:DUF3182 family protein [Luteimonas sp. XNQY3]MCD9007701.1 DUF3182 family protein [Luteimonas sp. XNQY3]
MSATAVSARFTHVLALPGPSAARPGHERATLGWVATQVARILALPFAGFADAAPDLPGRPYLVPQDTLVAGDATRWSIADDGALLGGAVPHAFVASKLITHALVSPAAAAPAGWQSGLGEAMRDVTFAGFSVFAPDDLHEACRRLLEAGGAARVKLADGIGGGGQHVVRDVASAAALLRTLTAAQVEAGIVVEAEVADAATYSVGEMWLGGRAIAYVGTQGLSTGRDGRPVYGGSTLSVVRGRMPDLLGVFRQPRLQRTIEMAIAYDRAAQAAYPALLCSRRNYDVLWGSDSHGNPHGGVLEQSWRVGGATPAELAAFDLLDREPALSRVIASTVERHGPVRVPAHAEVYCVLDDPHCGLITKFRHAGPDIDAPLCLGESDGSTPLDA